MLGSISEKVKGYYDITFYAVQVKDEKEIYVNSQICDDYIDISNEMISAFNFTKNANAISNKRKICNENNKTPHCTTKDFYKKNSIRKIKPHSNCTSSTNKNDTSNANPQNHIKQIDYTNCKNKIGR